MSCRSASKRANANARYIAKRAACPKSNAVRWISHEGGAFTEVTARVFALKFTTYPVDAERRQDVNWPLAAEMMNRAITLPGRPPQRHRWYPQNERYGQVDNPPEYFSISEVRERMTRNRAIESW